MARITIFIPSAPTVKKAATAKMPTLPTGNRPVIWIALGLVAINLFVYAQVWNYSFVNFDDPDYVFQNPYITAGLTAQGVVWALTTQLQANWHPLTWLSHMLDAQIYGLNPGGHHITSVLFHILNSILLFWVFYRASKAVARSAFVAAVFAVHPLHVESVAWVSERKDVLSTFFALLTIWAYMEYVRKRSSRHYCVVVLCLAFGLMTKPMLVTLPFVLLLLDFWPLRRRLVPQLLYEKIPLFLLAAASSVVTFVVQQQGHSVSARDALPLGFRVANAILSYFAYVGKALWPSGLACFYPYPYLFPSTPLLATAVVALMLSVVLAFRVAKKYPYVPVGWFWFLGTLVPVIGFVQVGSQSMADRYAYLPLVGLSLIVSWGVPDLLSGVPRRKSLLLAASALAVALLAIDAHMQVKYWKDSVALWSRALDVTSNNYMAHYALGSELGARGNHQEAIAHLQEALRINPEYTPGYNSLGIQLAESGKLNEATVQFSEVIRRDPGDASAHNNLGNILVAEGKLAEAAQEYEAALRLSPDYLDARSNLASLLIKQGNFEAAIREASEVLRIDPSHPNARQMMQDLQNRGVHGTHP
jgi:tetratricopeptide (TPR) repeat protein